MVTRFGQARIPAVTPPPVVGGGASRGRDSAGSAPAPLWGRKRRSELRKGEMKREAVKMEALIRSIEAAYPQDAYRQLTELWPQVRLEAARGRQRTVSVRTEDAYMDVLRLTLNDLASLNMRAENLSGLTIKQLRRLFQTWETRGLAASTLQQRLTVLRRFYGWTGHLNIPTLAEMLVDPKNASRSSSATVSKAWSMNGMDPDLAIAQMEKVCPVTAMHMRMERHWGLRVQEALSINVFAAEHGDGTLLLVNRNTKGGRGRMVPLDTPARRNLLRAAQAMANPNTGVVQVDPRKTLDQARTHYNYMINEAGFSKRVSGVTSHGLRHEYALDRYRERTNQEAPVAGGVKVDPALEREARQSISFDLGHTRPSITTAYLGSIQQMNRIHLAVLTRLLSTLEARNGTVAKLYWTAHRAASAAGCDLRLYVVGEHATGAVRQGPKASPVLLGYETVGSPIVALGSAEARAMMNRAVLEMTGRLGAAVMAALQTPAYVIEMAQVQQQTPLLELFATDLDRTTAPSQDDRTAEGTEGAPQ